MTTLNLNKIIDIAYKAGEEILKIYKFIDVEVEYKKDNSPLTEADKKAHEVIEQGLKNISNYPILSEEGKDIPYKERQNWEYFWLVDPLDGTKEFIKKNGQFTVNIALIQKNKPVAGVVYAPALDILYYGTLNEGAYKIEKGKESKVSNSNNFDGTVKVIASKSHLNEETTKFIENLKIHYKNVEMISIGSSLKICFVAEGKADIYPRIAPTMEWDTAAAHAILNAVKGRIVQYKEYREIYKIKKLPELIYNKKNLLNPYFIAFRENVF